MSSYCLFCSNRSPKLKEIQFINDITQRKTVIPYTNISPSKVNNFTIMFHVLIVINMYFHQKIKVHLFNFVVGLLALNFMRPYTKTQPHFKREMFCFSNLLNLSEGCIIN